MAVRDDRASAMPLRVYDDRARELLFLRPPLRVVSLVPSETLNVFALGAGDRLFGRTRYCVAPEGQVEKVPEVGGTKDVDVQAVAALEPDLILCNQEENSRPHIEQLARLQLPVFVSFPRRVADGLSHLARLSRIFGDEEQSRELLRRGLRALRDLEARPPPLDAFVPIWMEPLMTVNADTFISDALELAGGRNVFADRERRYPLQADIGGADPRPAGERDTRYPRVTLDEVVRRAPRIVLLPDEPHPFSEADARVFRTALPAAKIAFCSGRDLSWPGAQSVEGLPRLRALLDSLR
ncbi:MAG TPA: helical backbone metal receptor [Myxococcales bacterium]|nr:helical backbone metal receptor [Myxococcales bacterium]